MKLSFDIELYDVVDQGIETTNGKVLLDGCTVSGIRVHVVDNHLEHPIVWRNAIVLGVNTVEEWKR